MRIALPVSLALALVAAPAFADKIALLSEIDAWARARYPRVVQVSASLIGERRAIEILRADDRAVRHIRPLLALSAVRRRRPQCTASCCMWTWITSLRSTARAAAR